MTARRGRVYVVLAAVGLLAAASVLAWYSLVDRACRLPSGAAIAYEGGNDSLSWSSIFVLDDGGDSRGVTSGREGFALSPAWSPDGKRIAFSVVDDPTTEDKVQIYGVNADGSGLRQLTRNPGTNHEPAWSPDGSLIAFSRYGYAKQGIWVMNADGSGQRRVTRSEHADLAPAWSPDGELIAFERNFGIGRGTAIYVVRVDGSGLRRLTEGEPDDRAPAWSPDGQRIAYESGGRGIYVMKADGTEQKALTDDGGHADPAWSPDGEQIAFASLSTDAIHVMDEDGGDHCRLTETEHGWWATAPAWSPVTG